MVDALKRVLVIIEIVSQGAVSRIRAELQQDDGDALRSVAASRAVL